jgi:hypothetical protein
MFPISDGVARPPRRGLAEQGGFLGLIWKNVFHSLESLTKISGDCDGDPLSPPEGEAAQGEHPLDPLCLRIYSLKHASL